MKLKKLLLILLLYPLFNNAQANLDSLWGVWTDDNQEDSSRLNALYEYGWEGYLFTQPDSAFYFGQKQFDFAKEKNLKRFMSKALNLQGISFQIRGNQDSASVYQVKRLKLTQEIGDKNEIVSTLNNLGIIQKQLGNYEEAVKYYTKSLILNEEIGDQEQLAGTHCNLGIIYEIQGNYDKAMQSFVLCNSISEENGDTKMIAKVQNLIGLIHANQGNYSKAIAFYSTSLKLFEGLNNETESGNVLNNIGTIYMSQGNYESALKYFNILLNKSILSGNKKNIVAAYNNIGITYSHLKNYDLAFEYQFKNLAISKEIKDKLMIAIALNNIGDYHRAQDQIDSALIYYNEGLQIEEAINDKIGISFSLYSIGLIHEKLGNIKQAINYCNKSLKIAEEIGYSEIIRNNAKALWRIRKKEGNHEESLKMYELYITTRDSIDSEENQKAAIQQEYKYAYEKQAAADSIKAFEAAKVKDALILAEKAENQQHIVEAEHQQMQKYFLFGGLFLALLFGGFIFNRFNVTKKQKSIIEEQKQKVDLAYDGLEEAHKEITDSINYAERIQRSFLATTEILEANLDEYFVYFNPKEAVSGDFYWADKLSNGDFAIVNADSTGHGVPGAIMSILNISSIESAIKDKFTKPADIFNDTRKTIINRLKKDGSEHGGKDGMDASLVSFNSDKTKMFYVAAQNPIWIIRNGELTEIKPEKMPVGKHDKDNTPFEGGEFDLQKGDQIYTLTDGFQDQFGGPKGKKFMVKKMREYVLSISHLPMNKQRDCINTVFSEWKGKMEQVDDVCVIGVRI